MWLGGRAHRYRGTRRHPWTGRVTTESGEASGDEGESTADDEPTDDDEELFGGPSGGVEVDSSVEVGQFNLDYEEEMRHWTRTVRRHSERSSACGRSRPDRRPVCLNCKATSMYREGATIA